MLRPSDFFREPKAKTQSAVNTMVAEGAPASSIVSLEFEVFGKVQGVYFTKYCRDRCLDSNIVGWVKNSKRGTIVGKIQGEKHDIEAMVSWLSKEGSPGCHIERCDLSNLEYLVKKEFKNFSIRF